MSIIVSLPPPKLRVPDVRMGSVLRARLFAELDDGVRHGIVCVCAPAGTGKTTLLSSWCRRAAGQRRQAWLSLDGADNDLAAFLHSVAAALDLAVPGVGRDVLRMARGGRVATHQMAIPSLVHQIGRSGVAVTLILDGCDVLTSPAVLHALTDLVEQRPSELSVVLVSRAVPSLPLALWRQRGELHVITGESLRFLPAEAGRFLKQTLRLRLERAHVVQLTERTEGWITGLQLAAESVAQAPASADLAAGLLNVDQRVQDYLYQDVLAVQPEWIVSFLMETAVLEAFCAPLCDAVRGISVPIGWPSPSETALAEIERANLFLTPLDPRPSLAPHGRWFRYHPLFAAALVARLERIAPRHPAELRQRASRWLSEGGHAAGAIRPLPSARPMPAEHTVPLCRQRMIETLTGREMEVLRCIATGASNHAVAEQLSISPATAKKHTSNIFGKLGVTSRTQAVVQAQDLGLL